MHLSKRLQMVTDCVTKGSTVADVGCDHAYISIYLVENKIATSTVALDINKGPLERAAINVKDYGYEDRITTRLSDGLQKLQPGEADSIVIAGIGGELMVRILSEGDACVKAAKEVVLQPQSEVDKVRRYLHKLGYKIVQENMCIDDGKFYVVIHAMNEGIMYDETVESTIERRVENKFGALLLAQKHPILEKYLEKEKRTTQIIIENLKANESEKNKIRQEQMEEELVMIEKALEFFQ